MTDVCVSHHIHCPDTNSPFLKCQLVNLFLWMWILAQSGLCSIRVWYCCFPFKFMYRFIQLTDCSTTRVDKSRCQLPMWLNFVQWQIIFVGPQYGTCFISPLQCLEFCGGSQNFVKFVHPCFAAYIGIVTSMVNRYSVSHLLLNPAFL